MSCINPYVRSGLLATRKEVAEPSLLVDLWADQFLELGANGPGRMEDDEIYDWIALGGRLRRCREDLLQATQQGDNLANCQTKWESQLKDLLPKAIHQAQPKGWLLEADQLARACDEGKTEEELALWAERLFTDLDDADLLAWAARHVGQPDQALESGLADCFAWLEENCDRFFPAGVFIQAMGQTIRTDLDVYDWELVPSAEKIVVFLDALEEAETLFPLESDREEPVILFVKWPVLPAPLGIAASPSDSRGLQRRRWQSPDGRFRALLVLDSSPGASPIARINLESVEGPAAILSGQSAWLAGCASVIDGMGNVDFGYEALRQASEKGHPFDFAVGDHKRFWIPQG